MASREELEVLINSSANLAGIAETKAGLDGLTQSHHNLGSALQTTNVYFDQTGQKLSAQESRYAEAQLASMGFAKTTEADAKSVGDSIARMSAATGSELDRVIGRATALGGVLGSTGALGIGIGAAVVGGGLVVEMMHSQIENAGKNEAAQRGLAQAFDTQGKSLTLYQADIDAWLDKNARYISSEYEAKDSIAALIRTGEDWGHAQDDMSVALDLAATKGISLTQATDELIRARAGDARALNDLGISLKNVEDPEKNLEVAQKAVTKATDEHTRALRSLDEWEAAHSNRAKLTHADLMHEQDLKDKVKKSTDDLTNADNGLAAAEQAVKDKGDKSAEVMDLLKQRVQGNKDKTDDLTQSNNQLNHEWEKLSNENGPALEGMLASIVGGIANVLDWLRGTQQGWDNFDKWAVTAAVDVKTALNDINVVSHNISDILDTISGKKLILNVGGNIWDLLNQLPNPSQGTPMESHRAAGGPVIAGGVYTVGERGPETLVMGSGGGGYVIPNGMAASGGTTINIGPIYGGGDSQAVADAIASRLWSALA